MKTIKLLLIEDEVNMGYIIKNGMESMIGGYEICVAANGEEGLKQLEIFKPDIVVSDVEMPGMSGLEVVRKIRQTDQDLPIILATGKTMPSDVTAGYDAGANNYIKKPFMPEELDAHIKAVLNMKTNSRLKLKNAIHKIGQHYTFEPKNYTLTYNNAEKKVLTARESQILELFLEYKGEIVKRNDILLKFWGDTDPFMSRSLDRFITQLRKYLSKDASISIKNIKPIGLIFEVD